MVVYSKNPFPTQQLKAPNSSHSGSLLKNNLVSSGLKSPANKVSSQGYYLSKTTQACSIPFTFKRSGLSLSETLSCSLWWYVAPTSPFMARTSSMMVICHLCSRLRSSPPLKWGWRRGGSSSWPFTADHLFWIDCHGPTSLWLFLIF